MPKDYIKVTLLSPNPLLSDGPYQIIGKGTNSPTGAFSITLKSSVTKNELIEGVPVSASDYPAVTSIRVNSLDPVCTSFSEVSVSTLPGVTPTTVFFEVTNLTDTVQYGASITTMFLRETGSTSNISMPLYKDGIPTAYPVFNASAIGRGSYLVGSETTNYTIDYATASIDTNGGDYDVFVRVSNLPSNTLRFTTSSPKLYIINNITNRWSAKIATNVYSGSTCQQTVAGAFTASCVSTQRVYKFRTGYINGNNTLWVDYQAQTTYTTPVVTNTTTQACVDPNTEILLSETGITKLAGNLKVGDVIYTYNYKNDVKSYGYYTVKEHSIEHTDNKILMKFEDGEDIIVSDTHNFMMADETWKQVFEFTGNEVIKGIHKNKKLISMENIGSGDVVSMAITDAHTYISNGLVSHNRELGLKTA